MVIAHQMAQPRQLVLSTSVPDVEIMTVEGHRIGLQVEVKTTELHTAVPSKPVLP